MAISILLKYDYGFGRVMTEMLDFNFNSTEVRLWSSVGGMMTSPGCISILLKYDYGHVPVLGMDSPHVISILLKYDYGLFSLSSVRDL